MKGCILFGLFSGLLVSSYAKGNPCCDLAKVNLSSPKSIEVEVIEESKGPAKKSKDEEIGKKKRDTSYIEPLAVIDSLPSDKEKAKKVSFLDRMKNSILHEVHEIEQFYIHHNYRINKSNFLGNRIYVNDLGEIYFIKGEGFASGEKLVLDIESTQSGTIYIATLRGILVSDDFGRSFSTKKVSKKLLGLWVYDLYVDHNEVLYAATIDGLFISNDHGNTFTQIGADSGLSIRINGVFVDEKGIIYVATYEGFFISRNNGKTFEKKTEKNGFKTIRTNKVYVDGKGIIYVATGEGLSISTDRGKSFITKNRRDGLGSFFIHDVYVDKHGQIYVLTASGVSISTEIY